MIRLVRRYEVAIETGGLKLWLVIAGSLALASMLALEASWQSLLAKLLTAWIGLGFLVIGGLFALISCLRSMEGKLAGSVVAAVCASFLVVVGGLAMGVVFDR